MTINKILYLLILSCRDTVSSVGVIRDKNLPLTNSAKHICYFRHALALDERRVKFLPKYIYDAKNPQWSPLPRVKEVWFAGTHSDM